MTKKQEVKDILTAIRSVRFRATNALNLGDYPAYANLMGDLLALEMVLVDSTEAMMTELDSESKKVA